MMWNYDDLLAKAKLYAQRAQEQGREGSEFPFLATLTLEFIARASLAKIHPALLADPTEGKYILHAFGFGSVTNPKSIPAKTLFTRCKDIVPEFTELEFNYCIALIERRNQELHSGKPAFEDFPTNVWLADYWRVCSLLLKQQKLDLIDLFSKEEADAAKVMIQAIEKKVIKKVKDLIAKTQKAFQALSQEDSANKVVAGKKMLSAKNIEDKIIKCPACENGAILSGHQIKKGDPKATEDSITQEVIVLPTKFKCGVCGLRFDNHIELHSAGLGGQYTQELIYEPADFYKIDPADYYEDPDYGND